MSEGLFEGPVIKHLRLTFVQTDAGALQLARAYAAGHEGQWDQIELAYQTVEGEWRSVSVAG